MSNDELQYAINEATIAVKNFYAMSMIQELIATRKYLRELRELQIRKAGEKLG